jgi:hypothetical protein
MTESGRDKFVLNYWAMIRNFDTTSLSRCRCAFLDRIIIWMEAL